MARFQKNRPPGSFEVDLDGTWDPFLSVATDQCSHQTVDISGDMIDFWSSDTTIAKVTASGIQGVAPGFTSGNGDSELVWVGAGSNCILKSVKTTAPVQVRPTINNITPNSGQAGASGLSVTITGTGFGTAATVSFNGTGITAAVTQPTSDGLVLAKFNIASNAPVGFQGVIVTNTTLVDGIEPPPSAPFNFQVTSACPSTITVGTPIPISLNDLFPSPYGYRTGVGAVAPMQVGPSTTNWNNVRISESVSVGSGSTCGPGLPSQYQPANLCTGSTTFVVGQAGSFFVPPETPLAAITNVFYDGMTGPDAGTSILNSGSSCTIVCTQQYSCNGSNLGPLFTITRKFQAGTLNGAAVTTITSTKQ